MNFKKIESARFAHAGVMLALREIRSVLASKPEMEPNKAAAIRRSALTDGASYDFETALELIEIAPEVCAPSNASLEETCRVGLMTILNHGPVGWSSLVTAGTDVLRERLRASARNVLQCFEYARLFDNDEITYAWWDEADGIVRAQENVVRTESGRSGENLTIKHERRKLADAGRPDLEPTWTARQNAYAGYDVESYDVTGPTARRIYIECKACTKPPLTFHLTPNEVKVASLRAEAYFIHLWDLQLQEDGLTQISVAEIGTHLPTNNGTGRWQDVRISWPPTAPDKLD